MEYLHVGKFITTIIERKGLKKKDFAKAMNYSPTNIQALLNRDDWHLKRILQAEEILKENILMHFVKLPERENTNNMVMEESPAYIVNRQNEQLKKCEAEREQGKEVLEIVLEQNKFLKDKIRKLESN